MALMAMGANAQGSYRVPSDWKTGDVTSVTGVTMSYGDFSNLKSVPEKFTDTSYEYKVSASSNATDADGKTCNVKTSNLVPSTGGFVKFVPTVAGTIAIAYKLNKSKIQYFVEDGNILKQEENNTTESVYNLTSFTVKANSVYYVYTQGSKMDFFGFDFTTNTTGISNVGAVVPAATDGVEYNMTGVPAKSGAKGVVIVNGKKVVK